MSSWNKVGLVDQKAIIELKKEIENMRRENARAMKKQAAEAEEQQKQAVDSLRTEISELKEKISVLEPLMKDLLVQISVEKSEILNEVKQENLELQNIMKQEIKGAVSEMANREDKLDTIEQYLDSLWEAMKLVWINDLIDMVEE